MIRYGFVLEVVLYFLVKKLVILVFSEKCRILKAHYRYIKKYIIYTPPAFWNYTKKPLQLLKTTVVCFSKLQRFLSILISVYFLNIRIEFKTHRRATPLSANTASHILAIPSNPKIITTILIASANTTFCTAALIALRAISIA